jgi:hypothetical protein
MLGWANAAVAANAKTIEIAIIFFIQSPPKIEHTGNSAGFFFSFRCCFLLRIGCCLLLKTFLQRRLRMKPAIDDYRTPFTPT